MISAIEWMLYVILNRKTPEERPPPFPEDINHYYSNTANPQTYLRSPETPEITFEIIEWDMHIHLSLQDVLSWRQVQHFQRQVSLLKEESTGMEGPTHALPWQRAQQRGSCTETTSQMCLASPASSAARTAAAPAFSTTGKQGGGQLIFGWAAPSIMETHHVQVPCREVRSTGTRDALHVPGRC